MLALAENISKFEAVFGEIKDTNVPPPNFKMDNSADA